MNRILHIIFTAAAFIAFSAAHVQAQTATDTRADSLQQAVNELSAEKKKLDIEKKKAEPKTEENDFDFEEPANEEPAEKAEKKVKS